jgi:anti-anti-sigma factor
MDLAPRRLANVVVLSLAGRIDHSRSDTLRAALEPHLATCSAEQDRLVLDLSQLEYISSAGLRVLILAQKQVKPRGGIFVVAAPRPMVKEIFEISRFTMIFDIHSSVRVALEQLSPTALDAFDAKG